MAKFVLEPGESVISNHRVSLIEAGKRQPATVMLTTRRIVAMTSANLSRMATLSIFGGLIGALIGSATSSRRATHTIHRQRFAAVEPGEGKLLVFHDTGEGYGHTSFAIETEDNLATWQERMRRWASGADDVAPLPAARVVDR